MSSKSVLIIVGGGRKHLYPFEEEAAKLGIDLTCASFSQISFFTEVRGKIDFRVSDKSLGLFDVVYVRLVGKRFEELSLLVDYCSKNNIRVVDKMFLERCSVRMPYPKSLETKLLFEAGIPVPRTLFGNLDKILSEAPNIFGYPFVIKGTTGKQGHAVWSPRNLNEVSLIRQKIEKARKKEPSMRFLAQEFVKASQRNRVFVLGDKAIAAITRPTRWRRRFVERVDGSCSEGVRKALVPVPKIDAELAIKAASSLGVEVAGVDIITEDSSGKKYVLEVNSTPRWQSIKEDTGVNVEREILKYLISL